ncbi:hypothetical protein PIB30_028570 [Stylosanthes scabra]|uniref:Secreted protein n=1 Tax=Stylosanthes scabra TaxID=79078 RepID=A0ABU6UAU9_9FABA|nr:hypothetical protein [Stylosanthes scabra]
MSSIAVVAALLDADVRLRSTAPQVLTPLRCLLMWPLCSSSLSISRSRRVFSRRRRHSSSLSLHAVIFATRNWIKGVKFHHQEN